MQKIKVSKAEPDDLLELVLLAREAFKEDIINKAFTFNTKGLMQLVNNAITGEDFLVLKLTKENEIVGYFFGMVSQCYFANETQSVCLSWFVQPEHRSVKGALLLLKEYEEWAKEAGVVLVNMVNSNLEAPHFFERLGYTMTETTFVKEV